MQIGLDLSVVTLFFGDNMERSLFQTLSNRVYRQFFLWIFS